MSEGSEVRKRVVIVGMGDTGLLTAVRLSRDFDVVGVSTKPCMLSGQELGLRLSQPTRWRVTSLIEFGRYRGLDGVRIIHGQAVSLDADRRELQVQTAGAARLFLE